MTRGFGQSMVRHFVPVILFGGLLSTSILAQAPLPPSISTPDQTNRVKIVLDKDARLVADEYVDLLRQLQDVVKDYSGYLQDSQSEIIKRYQKSLARLQERLNQGTYDDDTQLLGTDLEDQLEQLSNLETEVRESSEVFPMRIYRLIKSLRREMAGINDLVKNDLAERLEERDNETAAIAAYVRALLANLSVQVQTAPDGKTIVVIHNTGGKNGTGPQVIVTPAPTPMPKSKGQPKVVGESVMPAPIPEDSTIHIGTSFPAFPPIPPVQAWTGQAIEGAGVEKEFEDTIAVQSPKAVIHIESRMGQVTVTGGSSNQVTAHLALSYEADSRQREREFGNSVRLQVERRGEDYVVSTQIPKLDGSTLRIGSNELTVEVPAHNPVVVVNNLGSVSVSDVQSNVEVTSSYAQIELNDIAGNVTVSSATGGITLASVKGNMTLKNSYASIDVSDSRGDMDIQNAYGAVSVSGCRGNLKLRNSGVVNITDHTGDISVDNSFGPIDIQDIRGSLTASNRFQPITISEVRGPVTVEGANSAIELSKISGGVTAINRFAQISIDESSGPLKINNQNGSVSVILADDFRGNSSISTSFGNISLSVPATANLLLNAKTQFGSISSFTPLNLSESGQTKFGTLRLGTGRDSLSLACTNASISIDSK